VAKELKTNSLLQTEMSDSKGDITQYELHKVIASLVKAQNSHDNQAYE
jgi:hypothetical protein